MNETIQADPIIEQLISWAEARQDVRAVILTSTRAATGQATDEFSDYDVILVVEDIQTYLEDGWLGDFGDILTVYRDPVREEFGFERFTRVTQYQDGLKIDFSVCPVEWLLHVAQMADLPHELDVGYEVLLDKDGLADGMQPFTQQAHVPGPPTPRKYLDRIEYFYNNCCYAAKHICRGDLLPLKSCMEIIRQEDLLPMLEWKIGLETGRWEKSGHYGKGLKKRLDEGTWQELESTFCGPGNEENWQALWNTVMLFRRMAQEVGGKMGFSYPQDMDDRTVNYLKNIRTKHS